MMDDLERILTANGIRFHRLGNRIRYDTDLVSGSAISETQTAAQPASEGHRPPAVQDLLPPAAYGLSAAEEPPPAVEGLLPPAAHGPHTSADVSMAALSRATSSSFASPAPKSPPQRALTPVPPPDDGAYSRSKLAFVLPTI